MVCGRAVATSEAGDRRFEGVREAEGIVIGVPPSGPGTSRALLRATQVPCRARGDICSAERCVSCHRFVNFTPSRDRRQVKVRCYWSGADLVGDLMTPARGVFAVPADATAGEARRLLSDYDREYLLVVESGVLVGVVRRTLLEWADSEQRVSTVTERRVWVTCSTASLDDLVEMVADNGADCVLVVDDTQLVGMVTRSDLREIGWREG